MTDFSLKQAAREAEASIGRPIKVCGFEQRELKPGVVVTILYYSVEYKEFGIRFRGDVWVNGKKNAGLSFT